jgi:hypothetical protein
LKIISGGQSGVDRAALDVAIKAGIPHGGFCPKGRRAEDGPIPGEYNLTETDTTDYAVRTEMNVDAGDGTLILHVGLPLKGGTAFTVELATAKGKPLLLIDLAAPGADPRGRFREWIAAHRIETLNVACPRETQSPGIYERAKTILQNCFGA